MAFVMKTEVFGTKLFLNTHRIAGFYKLPASFSCYPAFVLGLQITLGSSRLFEYFQL